MIKLIGKIDIPEVSKKPKHTCCGCGNTLGKYTIPYEIEVRNEVYGTWHKEILCDSCYYMEVEKDIFNH